MVITPLERGEDAKGSTTVLVNRGWVAKKLRRQRDRMEGLPTGEVVVEGLLREPWKKNMFTPENRPDKGEFYFPDVKQMAELTGSQAVWVEQTMGTYGHGYSHADYIVCFLLHFVFIFMSKSADMHLYRTWSATGH